MVGADFVAGFANLASPLADLDGLLALDAFGFVIVTDALAKLLGFSGDGFQFVEGLLAAFDFVTVEVLLADLLDQLLVRQTHLFFLILFVHLALS
jgi:hypothetical protein